MKDACAADSGCEMLDGDCLRLGFAMGSVGRSLDLCQLSLPECFDQHAGQTGLLRNL